MTNEIAEEEGQSRTQADLIAYAKEQGINAVQLGTILKGGGITKFDAKHWEEMVHLIDETLPQNGNR